MDQGSLVIEEIEAGEKFLRAFNSFFPVKAAFWLKASDDEQRYLYVASDAFETGDLRKVYGEVGRLVRGMQSMWLDPYRVKLVTGDDPLTIAAADIHQRFPGRMATRIGGGRFGGLTIDDVYIYPTSLPATVPSGQP